MTVRGAELHLLDTGRGDPVMLVHGWPQHAVMWQPLLGELARGHRVLAPDLRGAGRSAAPRGDYSKHALAGDLLELLDHEGIDRATVIGHDWGGWIAGLLATEHPDRIVRFASLDVPPPGTVDLALTGLPARMARGSYQLAISAPLVGERLVRSRRAVRAFIRAGAAPGANLCAARLDEYARFASRPAAARAAVAMYRTFLVREVPQLARGTYTDGPPRVPGLVLMGGESAVARMSGIPRSRPGLRVEVLDGVGHFLVDEAPERVLAHLRPFLAGDYDDAPAGG